MFLIRSLLFNSLFVIITIIEMLFFAPVYFFLPRRYVWIVAKFWARTVLFLLKYIALLRVEVEGLENIAKIKAMSQSYIIAPKHQSALETFAILPYLDDPSYVLKRELMFIPFFGWYMAKTGIIAINRGSPLKALKQMVIYARQQVKQKRQILIFAEGTRRLPGDKPVYKSGIATLYSELNIPVLPIAHNAGLYWPKSSFYRYKGVLKIKILPPIAPGLDKKTFLEDLKDAIETNCNSMLVELSKQKDAPPFTGLSLQRLKNNKLRI